MLWAAVAIAAVVIAAVAIAAVAIAVLARPCQKGWEVVATVPARTGEGKCQAAGVLGEDPATSVS